MTQGKTITLFTSPLSKSVSAYTNDQPAKPKTFSNTRDLISWLLEQLGEV